MIFEKGATFKVLEMSDCLVITSSAKNVVNADPLVIADMPALVEYLDRYISERQAGATLKQAHDVAVKSAHAKIVKIQ